MNATMDEAGEDGRAKRRKTEASPLRLFLQLGASVSAAWRIAERLRDNPDININCNALKRASESIAAPLWRVHNYFGSGASR